MAEVISDIHIQIHIHIHLVIVENGQAFAYRRHLSGCDANNYLDAEVLASRHR